MERRSFLRTGLRGLAAVALGGVGLVLLKRSSALCTGSCAACSASGTCAGATRAGTGGVYWQLDPDLCIQCGRCATECVLGQSAVRCMHAFDLCGYCELCGGYFRPDARELNTGGENQLCPTGALIRRYVEGPYYEYTIDRQLCIGCGKCVKGCGAFGNGSLYLQVQQDLCVHCNECAIARACPADAFRRVSADRPYMLRG